MRVHMSLLKHNGSTNVMIKTQ